MKNRRSQNQDRRSSERWSGMDQRSETEKGIVGERRTQWDRRNGDDRRIKEKAEFAS